MNSTQVYEIASAIVNCRDLCGNEREACEQACHDAGLKFNAAVWVAALNVANKIWRESQQAAGVSPKYWVR